MVDLAARLNKEGKGHRRVAGFRQQLGGLIQRIADNTISNNIAKKVFEALWNGEGATADEVIDKQGLKQITDTGAIEALVDDVRRQRSQRRRIQGQGKGLQCAGRPGDEGGQGQGQPATGQRLLKRNWLADQRGWETAASGGVVGDLRVSSK